MEVAARMRHVWIISGPRLRALGATLMLLGVVAGLSLLPAFAADPPAAVCSDPTQPNAIVAENCLPGSPSSEWQVSGAGDPSIQGFATDISVNRGQTVRFKIDTDASAYRHRHLPPRLVRRRRRAQGRDGAAERHAAADPAGLPQRPGGTGIADCGNWAESASWAVPADAASGIYIARLVRGDTQGASHVAVRRARRRRRLRRSCSRPRTRPGRPTTATAATASTRRRPGHGGGRAAPTR